MKKFVIGILCILLGAFLLLNRYDFFEDWVYNLVISWPMLLAAIGLTFLIDRDSGHRTVGVFMLTIAVLFLIPRVPAWNLNLDGVFWPVIIIAGGVAIMLHSARPKTSKDDNQWYCKKDFKTDMFDTTTITG
ncbi:MAG: DUF5668 domain-containing protein, partial [Prevotellaceae bacterium]|nr:DUF5668 domain-containing protein [Prevotellaceae bacterium]